MKDSVIYQEILEEGMEKGMEKGIEKGRVTEARSLLLRRGAQRLGAADAMVQSRLEQINDLAALEGLTDRVIDGSFATWAELLASLA